MFNMKLPFDQAAQYYDQTRAEPDWVMRSMADAFLQATHATRDSKILSEVWLVPPQVHAELTPRLREWARSEFEDLSRAVETDAEFNWMVVKKTQGHSLLCPYVFPNPFRRAVYIKREIAPVHFIRTQLQRELRENRRLDARFVQHGLLRKNLGWSPFGNDAVT